MGDLFARQVVDGAVHARAVTAFARTGIRLPKLAELASPSTIDAATREALCATDPDTADPLNLFRVHWHNGLDSWQVVETPHHLVLPSALTGVPAKIVVATGDRFPMIAAHKVLAAYGCLVPRLVTG